MSKWGIQLLAVLALSTVPFQGGTLAADGSDKAFAACALLGDSLERLRCYDNATKASGLAPQPTNKTPSASVIAPSALDAMRRQYMECWNPPAGARGSDVTVIVNAEYNRDGSLRRADIADTSKMNDPIYRTMAESALRAVMNPRCNPIKPPTTDYDAWKSVELEFNPRLLRGQ